MVDSHFFEKKTALILLIPSEVMHFCVRLTPAPRHYLCCHSQAELKWPQDMVDGCIFFKFGVTFFNGLTDNAFNGGTEKDD